MCSDALIRRIAGLFVMASVALGYWVHPGFFFDFPHEAFIIVSLLPEPPVFADGVRRVLERVDA